MSPGDRSWGQRLGVLSVALYGASMASVGVFVAIGCGPPPVLPTSSAEGTLGRPVDPAPVVPAQASPTGGVLLHPASAAGIPGAQVGGGVVAGSPFQPSLLVFPSGSTAHVLSSGLHADGSLVIPDDPARVGWWNGGALAGDAFGSVVLAGHVDSARYGLGAMAQLRDVQVGQLVELRAGSRQMRYRVTSRREVPQAELAARSDVFRQDVAPRLVLITCGGAFDPVRHRYQDNVIVVADAVP